MIFNDHISILKKWCKKIPEIYNNRIAHTTCRDLLFKLSMKVDKEYMSYLDFLDDVEIELNANYHKFNLHTPKNKTEQYIKDKILKLFTEYLKSIPETVMSIECQYERIILGEEFQEIKQRFWDAWNYDANYWFPIDGTDANGRLYIMWDRLEPYYNQILDFLGSGKTHFYRLGEELHFTNFEYCTEVDFITNYDTDINEHAYTDKNFSWLVYFSHEDTISFAGTIVPTIKGILINEKEHWNKFVL